MTGNRERDLPRRPTGVVARTVMAAVTILSLAGGCRQEVTEVAGPGDGGPPVDTSGTGGGVQRVTLTVTVVTDLADSAVARQLGLSGGVLPNVEVVARREGSSDRATGRTDAQGVVRLTDLLPGRWSVSASRVLTDAERQQLVPEDRDVTAWAGGFAGQVNLSASVPLTVAAGRRGSLVISEWFHYAPPTATYQTHPWGQYIELYNNSDTTIYLDGKIFGKVIENVLIDSPNFPCAQTTALRLDTLGIWTRTAVRIPGTGREHPLAPGQTATIATDAIDHRPYNPTLLDLSSATFEFYMGGSDVDNPVSANLIPLTTFSGTEGHGPSFWGEEGLFIADGAPGATFRDSLFSESAVRILFIPKILDFVAETYAGARTGLLPMCNPLVARDFDRATGTELRYATLGTLERPVVGLSALGKPVLLRTRTSARDFVWVPGPSFGVIP